MGKGGGGGGGCRLIHQKTELYSNFETWVLSLFTLLYINGALNTYVAYVYIDLIQGYNSRSCT